MPTISAYTTIGGERWDLIAHKVYGDATLLNLLLEANPAHRATRRFSAGVVLTVPAAPAVKGSALPSWRAA